MDITAAGQTPKPVQKTYTGKISGEESLEVKKQKLRKVTKEFESYFLLYMLKAMRKTIPESGMLKGGPGKDIYTDMMDEEMARKMSGTSNGSLADKLYRSMEPQLEATYAAENQRPGDADITTDITEARRPVAAGRYYRSPETEEAGTPSVIRSQKPTLPDSPIRPSVSSDPIIKKYGAIINGAAKKYDVNPQLIYSVILAESGGDPRAVSSKGAKGLMQLMDTTASEMGVRDSLDVNENIMGGTKYLRKMLDTFDGDIKKALAAYNAGPGNVSKYNGVPPYPETRQYVDRVMGKLPQLKKY